MAEKFLQPKDLVIEVQRVDGEMISLTLKAVTYEKEKEFFDMTQKAFENNEDAATTNCKALAIFYGGKWEDYKCIDGRLVNKILKWTTEQFRNPS